ncbi:protoporphyrinogen oxidase [Marinilactibacillus kalidii]|uniref:protoporphyrinogen oxidase n=1 Tax=Marinilactibacillus kalidii TaxID=2820274 RepID=UPI001ABE5A75|nr:protoporphyrinogen oxidase [Marinilactibacillus kalidii]
MNRSKKRIAVIGTGITGLTTAFRLKKLIEENNLPFELIVLESSIRSGGKIHTMKMGEDYVDLGAESIDVRSGDALKLIEELGLQEEVSFSQNGKPDIYAFNKLYHVDSPTYKGIPAKRSEIWKYDILSFQGKVSYLKDTYLPAPEVNEETSVIQYLNDRVGSELTEYVVEPYYSQIYMNNMESTGMNMVDLKIMDLEHEHGNLTNAIEANPAMQDSDGNQISFNKGLETLTNALLEELKDHVMFSKKVTEIKKSIEGTYILDVNKKEQVRVGAVVVATDPGAYKEMFKDIEFQEPLKEIKSNSIGYAMFSFPKGSIVNVPEGNGVLCSRRNDSHISSVIWLNKKWKSLEERDEELLGVYFGKGNEEIMLSLSNRQIEELLLRDLEKMLGISEEPIYHVLKRWTNSLPKQSFSGDTAGNRLIEMIQQAYPGVYLAGNGIKGFGINSCIKQGTEVSQNIIHHLKIQNGL